MRHEALPLAGRGRDRAEHPWDCACPRSQSHRHGKENDSRGRRGHSAHWASLHAESKWILSLLAGGSDYDVQQTNKPPMAGIARGGCLEMLKG